MIRLCTTRVSICIDQHIHIFTITHMYTQTHTTKMHKTLVSTPHNTAQRPKQGIHKHITHTQDKTAHTLIE